MSSKGYVQIHEDNDIAVVQPRIAILGVSGGRFGGDSKSRPESRTAMEEDILKPGWKQGVTIELKEDWSVPEYSDAYNSPSPTLYRRRYLTRWSQFDSLVLVAGVVAILLGCTAVADAYTSFRIEAFETAQRQNVSAWNNVAPIPLFYPTIAILHTLPSWLPLVLFGIATAIAWTCTQRAVYRIALLESRHFLGRGFRIHDLCDMLETKRPTRSWFKWRTKMWKTTLFAVLCVCLYASTALMYRLAFSFRSKSFTYNLDTIGKESNLLALGVTTLPLFGCNSDSSNPSPNESDLGKSVNDTRMQLNMFADFVSLPEAFAETGYLTNITTSDRSWEVLFGVHGLYNLARLIELQAPQENFQDSMSPMVSTALEWDFQGPFISAVWSHDSNASVPDVVPYVGTKSHPACGDLLYVCTSKEQGDCYYLGLYPGNFTSHKAAVQTNDPGADLDPLFDSAIYITGPDTIDMPGNCPTQLDTGIYAKLSDEYTSFWAPCNTSAAAANTSVAYLNPGLAGDNHNWLSDCAEGPLRTVFAMLLAYLANNPSLILDTQSMVDLGLLTVNASINQCQQPLRYDGSIVAFWAVSTWPAYELGSAVALIIWGALLLFASWPFKQLVFRGTVEHWLALGADIGAQHAKGDGILTDRWRLRTWVDDARVANFRMERVIDQNA